MQATIITTAINTLPKTSTGLKKFISDSGKDGALIKSEDSEKEVALKKSEEKPDSILPEMYFTNAPIPAQMTPITAM